MKTIDSAARSAIAKTVADFQAHSSRFWNERDLHWNLFHYLKQQFPGVEAYPTELIRAEFPTLEPLTGPRPSRGHYDIVLLDEASYSSPEVQAMKSGTPWEEYLENMKLAFAMELKLWESRASPQSLTAKVAHDVAKLTSQGNVRQAYFLNFVQLDFGSEHMREFYAQLCAHLAGQKKQHPALSILCVPAERGVQPESQNWM